MNKAMMKKKMLAVRKGKLADCVFRVGPNDQSAETIYASKFDLCVASEYFETMLKSPLTPAGPVRIKHVKPDTFNLVIEFTHTGMLLSPVKGIWMYIALASAADEFLIKDLGTLCTTRLEPLVSVENVWQVFNTSHTNTYVAQSCRKVLTTQTMECLQQNAFLGISESALVHFLTIDSMNIKSEMDLVNVCLNYISSSNVKDTRNLFGSILPHLRLLNLKSEDLFALSGYLTMEEKICLMQQQYKNHPWLATEKLTMLPSLCPIQRERNSEPIIWKVLEFAKRFWAKYSFWQN